MLAAADALAITLAAVAGFVLIGGGSVHALELALVALPAWILLFKIYGLYDADAGKIGRSTVDDIPALFHVVMLGELLLWGAYRLFTTYHFYLAEVLGFGLVAFGGTLIGRYVVRHLAIRLTRPERLLIVGAGPTTQTLMRKIASHPEYGLKAVGYISEPDGEDELGGILERYGHIADFTSACSTRSVERVVVDAASLSGESVVEIVRRANDLELMVTLVPQVSDVLGAAVALDHIEGMAVLGLSPPVLLRSSRFLKRLMDLLVAVPLLLLTLPLILAAAALIKITSPGPAFYSQQRLGRRGRPFRIVKLRTMVSDAEDRAQELMSVSRHPAWLLLDRDPRVTTVGRMLRRTSIDELPQLWNVIKGEMSLVGPRPMPADIHAQIPEWGRRRLDLTPGITGLWQVLGRTSIPFEEMVKLDYLYVTNWSLWEDVRLLLQTLPTVLARRGAN